MKIRRITQSQDQLDADDARVKGNELGVERAIYRQLSSLTDNKVIVDPTGPDTEYDRFLLHMNEIQKGIQVSAFVDQFDEYLGTLGVTNDYPFPDDTYWIDSWIDIPKQEQFRNVVDNNSNVIADVNGTVYNVTHNTEK